MRLLLVAVAALVFAGSALADTTYTDPAGETAGSADITTVVASNDATAHTVKLTVQTNMPTLEPNSEVDLVFDSDNNATTGSQGFEYVIGVDATGWFFQKWDGTKWVDDPTVTNAGIQYVNGLLTVVLKESDIATAVGKTFTFAAVSFRGPDPANPIVDTAGTYSYTLAAPVVVKPTVTSTTVTTTAPNAGTKFRVGPFEVNLSDGTSVTATGVKCTATLGGVTVKGTGAGGCTFALPKSAKKKRIVVKVTGVYGGATISRTVTFVVK